VIDNWEPKDKKWVGSSSISHIQVELDICSQGNVRMIAIENGDLTLIDELCKELGLTILGEEA
jgi:hypothetical protein